MASEGGDPLREAEADGGEPAYHLWTSLWRLRATGRSPLHQRGVTGAPLKRKSGADLLLVSANPAEDIKNLRRVALRMVAGEWAR